MYTTYDTIIKVIPKPYETQNNRMFCQIQTAPIQINFDTMLLFVVCSQQSENLKFC